MDIDPPLDGDWDGDGLVGAGDPYPGNPDGDGDGFSDGIDPNPEVAEPWGCTNDLDCDGITDDNDTDDDNDGISCPASVGNGESLR